MSSVSELLRESRRRSYIMPGQAVAAGKLDAKIFAAIERHDVECTASDGGAYDLGGTRA